MSKVTIVFNSTKAQSLLSYVLAQAYSNGDTIETINAVNMDTTALNAAIAGLTAEQDIAYVAMTTNVDVSTVQLAAIAAKVTDANVIQWDTAATMADSCWDYFNTVTSSPKAISDLTAAGLDGSYLEYSIVAYGNKVVATAVSVDTTKLDDLTDLLDVGILSPNINSCRVGNLSAPIINETLYDELLASGQAVYDSLDIYDNTTAYPQSSLSLMLTFVLAEETIAAVIDDDLETVTITVANGTTVTALEPTVTVSPDGTVSPLSGAATDFTAPVEYTVTAQDSVTTKVYTVTVIVAA